MDKEARLTLIALSVALSNQSTIMVVLKALLAHDNTRDTDKKKLNNELRSLLENGIAVSVDAHDAIQSYIQ